MAPQESLRGCGEDGTGDGGCESAREPKGGPAVQRPVRPGVRGRRSRGVSRGTHLRERPCRPGAAGHPGRDVLPPCGGPDTVFDDYLLTAAAADCRQVVLLAAGIDSRAFRLPWPDDMRVFEPDLPEVLAFKEAVLAGCEAVPNCERTLVPVDLREHWATELAAAGFDRTAPTAWLAEGLLLYLTADEAVRLLTEVGEFSAPDSQLSFEHGTIADSALLTQARGMPAMDQYIALWKGGLGEDAPGWLSRHGWQSQLHDRAELAASYRRPGPESSSGGFLTAVRADR